jgi:hypothetical protein
MSKHFAWMTPEITSVSCFNLPAVILSGLVQLHSDGFFNGHPEFIPSINSLHSSPVHTLEMLGNPVMINSIPVLEFLVAHKHICAQVTPVGHFHQPLFVDRSLRAPLVASSRVEHGKLNLVRID